MSDMNALLSKRLGKNEKNSKMAEMAKQSATGNLTSFTGLFSLAELSENEKGLLEAILEEYSTGKNDITADFTSLISITSEVKAINNQAAMLHGERIKKAQNVLKGYKEGAFTAWLMATYGNRQTPYNFLQYYDFYHAMPKILHPKIESMPRQAVYTLASREGSLEKKRQIVSCYNGETKTEVLNLIRERFPLIETDKRKKNLGDAVIRLLSSLSRRLQTSRKNFSKNQKGEIKALLDEIGSFL